MTQNLTIVERPQPARRGWLGALLAALFLALCLTLGLLLGRWVAPQPAIGVVRFDAPIDFVTAEQIITVLDEARRDPTIEGVVIEILSPGGYATSSESIFYSMLQLREEKPLVVSIDALAASGGYYMAVAGNRIFAPSSAYVGNIGSRGGRPTDPKLSPFELSTGPYKLTGGSRFDRIRQLDLVGGAFVQNVVHQRQNSPYNPLTIEPEAVAEARIYLGSEALAIGLIDDEGGTSDAILAAAELAGLGTDFATVNLLERYDIQIVPPLPEFTLLDGSRASLDMQDYIREMVETAPPDMIYLLDERLALPAMQETTALRERLMELREGR